MEGRNIKISLVIITLNEVKNIRRCIESVSKLREKKSIIVDDIVVLDSGSTDATVKISKELGAKTFVEEWRGYGSQKSRATELAKNDWVLSLDADEALSADLEKEIIRLVTSTKLEKANGYQMPRVSYHLGRWILHGGWYPDLQMRLFNRKKCQWSLDGIHERVQGENIDRLAGDLQHFPFVDIADQINTNNEYSSLAAEDLFAKGKQASYFKIIFKPFFKFLETYVLKKGFLDGFAGWVISVGAAYAMFLKLVKLKQMYRNKVIESRT